MRSLGAVPRRALTGGFSAILSPSLRIALERAYRQSCLLTSMTRLVAESFVLLRGPACLPLMTCSAQTGVDFSDAIGKVVWPGYCARGITPANIRDSNSTRAPVNPTLNESLVRDARRFTDNLSGVVEELPGEFVERERQRRRGRIVPSAETAVPWNAIEAEHGTLSDGYSTL